MTIVALGHERQVRASAWGLGRIEWTVPVDGKQMVSVEGLEQPDDLSVPDGVEIVWHQ